MVGEDIRSVAYMNYAEKVSLSQTVLNQQKELKSLNSTVSDLNVFQGQLLEKIRGLEKQLEDEQAQNKSFEQKIAELEIDLSQSQELVKEKDINIDTQQ